ncbi:MAG TPA: hypothetical protein VEQ11_21285 [Chloroflexota bacterium]|nr:hypothetical protein [Chloroflexota bacterium]
MSRPTSGPLEGEGQVLAVINDAGLLLELARDRQRDLIREAQASYRRPDPSPSPLQSHLARQLRNLADWLDGAGRHAEAVHVH